MNTVLKVVYRLAGSENLAPRPLWYSKAFCLKSFILSLESFRGDVSKTILLDRPEMVPDSLQEQLDEALNRGFSIIRTSQSGNCQSYQEALDIALSDRSDLILLAEDDYLWSQKAIEVMDQAFEEIGQADYITPYDHPARYGLTDDTPDFEHWCNKRFCTPKSHFIAHESTCMTFMVRSSVLEEDVKWHRMFSDLSRNCPSDRKLFRFLQGLGGYNPPNPRLLLGPIPSLATHAHLPFLAPVINWAQLASEIGFN